MKWEPESVSRYCLLPLWQQKYYDRHKYWGDKYSHSSPSPQPVILGGGFTGSKSVSDLNILFLFLPEI